MRIRRAQSVAASFAAAARQNRYSTASLLLAFVLSVRVLSAAPGARVDGYVLLGEMNCSACHAASEKQIAWLSPKMAPRLAGIGNRASAEWVQGYLAAPHETQPGTTMPDVLHEDTGRAEALTHYLFSPGPVNFRRVMPDRAAVARGEGLYHRIGCVACHAPQSTTTNQFASIALPRMAEKWSFDGLRRFLQDPLASRPSGRMPAMHLTESEAADLAHYLLRETKVPAALELAQFGGRIRSLEDLDSAELSRTGPATSFTLDTMGSARGYALRFTGWLRVEQAGEYTFFLTATGASRLAVSGQWVMGEDSWERERADAKRALRLTAGWHPIVVDFVQRGSKEPALTVEWEGPGIVREIVPASRLRSLRAPVPEPIPFVVDEAKAAKGRELYTEMNCAACHEAKAPLMPPPTLAALQTLRGCLAENPSGNTPAFHLTAAQRTALREAVTGLDQLNLTAPSSQQRVALTMSTFNCSACHARDGAGGVTPERDGFFTSNGEDLGDEGRIPPRLDGVGDRFRPVWLSNVLATGASVRPYFNTRMPQFGEANVGHLTDLFVALDRHGQPVTPSPDSIDVRRETGRKLVGTDGLSCIACHRFNRQPAHALQIIDLITVTERLNEDWFRRFLLDPNRFHPGTRMPSFWPDGVSPFPAMLGGKADRQFAALWTYLADGSRAKFPEGLSRQNMELIVGGEAIVYRGKLWEAGFRAVAVGYPGQLNAAFDAEEMRLSLLWRGRFLNAGPHWGVQGMGSIRPLGTDVVVFPHGAPMAVLADPSTPWPADPSKVLGMKFRGYQLDALKRPTLLYSFRNVGVEDFLIPTGKAGTAGLRRTIQFNNLGLPGLYLRLAVGKLQDAGENAWRLNDALTIRVSDGAKEFVRGDGEQQELLVPIPTRAGKSQLEVEYVW